MTLMKIILNTNETVELQNNICKLKTKYIIIIVHMSNDFK